MRYCTNCPNLCHGKQNFVGIIADIDEMRNSRGFDRLIFQAEPTAFGNVLR